MGNEHTTQKNRADSPDHRALYSIELQVGEIAYPMCKPGDDFPVLNHETSDVCLTAAGGKGVAIEVLIHCKGGDIGPLPMSQLQSGERRKMEMWSNDYGAPKYCIIIMYREQYKEFPRWTIEDCLIQCTREGNIIQTKFKHRCPIYGGDAVVYSITMAPYFTSEDKTQYHYSDDGPSSSHASANISIVIPKGEKGD